MAPRPEQDLQWVSSTKYLGVIISYGHFEMQTIQHRISEAKQKLHLVRKFVIGASNCSESSNLGHAAVSTGSIGYCEQCVFKCDLVHFARSCRLCAETSSRGAGLAGMFERAFTTITAAGV